MTDTPTEDLDRFVRAATERKAIGLVLLDVHDLTSVADVFMICSGRSNRQVSAIADHIQRELKTQGIKALSVDGKPEGHWVLMDYGHVVIHIFYEPIRRFYDLESLWIDAPRLETPALRTHREQMAKEGPADDTPEADVADDS